MVSATSTARRRKLARRCRLTRTYRSPASVLEANPLQHIDNTGVIHAVVLDGAYIPSEQLSKLKGERAFHARVEVTAFD